MAIAKEWKKKRRFRQSFAVMLQKILNRPLQSPPWPGPCNSIIILAQEKYGDAILLTPLLKNLKRQFPETQLHLVTFSKATTAFFIHDPNLSGVHYAKSNPAIYIRNVLLKRFDILFNTKDHPSTNFLIQSLIIRARCKAGIANAFHKGIYDYLIDIDYHSPVALKNCGLLDILGKPADPGSCRPYIPVMPVADEVKAFSEKTVNRQFIGLNISAGGPTRYWTEENWKTLVGRFHHKQFIVLSTPADCLLKQALERDCPNIETSPATGNIYEAGLLVRNLELLVTPDTAMIHVASCSNTPVIGLYGTAPQDQSRFKPFLVEHRVLVSPSILVRDIEPACVIDAIHEMLLH